MTSLTIPYDCVDQADMRLRGCVILIDGDPCEVMRVKQGAKGKNLLIEYAALPGRHKVDEIGLEDDRVNFRQIPLGYVNNGGDAYYLRRTPARQQRQGLCNGNVLVSAGVRRQPRFNDLIITGPFKDMIHNTYPTIDEALALFEKDADRVSVAIHRHFAMKIDRDFNSFELHYKGQRIAWGDPHVWNLPSHLSYMKEIMQESKINFRM